jgi:hypothetical protein
VQEREREREIGKNENQKTDSPSLELRSRQALGGEGDVWLSLVQDVVVLEACRYRQE